MTNLQHSTLRRKLFWEWPSGRPISQTMHGNPHIGLLKQIPRHAETLVQTQSNASAGPCQRMPEKCFSLPWHCSGSPHLVDSHLRCGSGCGSIYPVCQNRVAWRAAGLTLCSRNQLAAGKLCTNLLPTSSAHGSPNNPKLPPGRVLAVRTAAHSLLLVLGHGPVTLGHGQTPDHQTATE